MGVTKGRVVPAVPREEAHLERESGTPKFHWGVMPQKDAEKKWDRTGDCQPRGRSDTISAEPPGSARAKTAPRGVPP